jgi:hypothetical protein
MEPLPKIPSDNETPEIRVGAFFEEMGAADKRHISYADWLRRPRWERAAMMARDRLQARLDYWSGQWMQGKALPALAVTRG